MTVCDKPVTRATLSRYRGRDLVITLHPTYLAVRLKGKRSGFVLDYQAIYECAAKLAAREARAEKVKQKGVKGKR